MSFCDLAEISASPYKFSQTTLFRRSEIEEWIKWQQKHGIGDYWTKKRKYKEDN